MPIGMGVIDPKFNKGGRKFKSTKHCTIPLNLEKLKCKNAYRIMKRRYLLYVGKEQGKRHHSEKYAERYKNLMGRLEIYNQDKSRMDQEGKSISCQ